MSSNGSCPFCKSPNAYQGLTSWECPNETCRSFSPKQKLLVEEEHQRRLKEQKESGQQQEFNLESMTEEELERRAEEEALIRDINGYGQIWGLLSLPKPNTTNTKIKSGSNTTPDNIDDAQALLNPLFPH